MRPGFYLRLADAPAGYIPPGGATTFETGVVYVDSLTYHAATDTIELHTADENSGLVIISEQAQTEAE